MPKGKSYKMKNNGNKGRFKGNAMSRSAMKASKGKSTMKRTPLGKV